MNKTEIIKLVKAAGVVGAGGAGFPTHIKLQANVNTVIANGAECEPLLANDKALMILRTDELLKGLELVADTTGAKRRVLAIKAKNSEVIKHFQTRTGAQAVEIFPLEDYYPAGDEQEIVREVTGKTVPEGGLPLEVGALIQNIETLINIARSIEGTPVTRRVLTVVGEVAKPSVVEVPIGMSARDVITACGGLTCENPALYFGGPMMGEVKDSLDEPITKTTGGLFVLPADNFLILKRSIPMKHILRQAQSACTNCMQCTEVCPRYLLGHKLRPHKIMNAVTLGLSYQSDVIMEAYLCMFCGMCEFACPLWLSPRRVYFELRAGLQKRNLRFERTEKPVQNHPMRKHRRVPPERIIRRYELSKYAKQKIELEIKSLETTTVRLPTRMGSGSPAIPIVKVGDRVKTGQLIGEIPEGSLGACIHASINGRVIYAGPDAVGIEG